MFGLTTKAKDRAVAHAVKEATGDPGFAVQIIDRKSLARDPERVREQVFTSYLRFGSLLFPEFAIGVRRRPERAATEKQ